MEQTTRTWIRSSSLLASLFVCVVYGCSALFPEQNQQTNVQSPLKPIVDSRDAIALEVYFLDRRRGDPIIGDTLWESLHSVSSMDAATRKRLTGDGFRIGMSAARPPRPLQVLMNLSDENDPTRRSEVRSYMVFSDHQTLVACRQIEDGTNITRIPLEGATQSFVVRDGLAVFNIQVSRVEDGWAKLVVIPEIQHGKNMLKPTATEANWTLTDRKNTVSLFENRFSAELNIGEIIVLGMTEDAEDRIASHFFLSDKHNGLERLMMIRIADIRSISPQRHDPESY